MTSSFALKYDVHNVHCGLFRQSSSQRLIFVLYPSRLRQIKCKTVWGKKHSQAGPGARPLVNSVFAHRNYAHIIILRPLPMDPPLISVIIIAT